MEEGIRGGFTDFSQHQPQGHHLHPSYLRASRSSAVEKIQMEMPWKPSNLAQHLPKPGEMPLIKPHRLLQHEIALDQIGNSRGFRPGFSINQAAQPGIPGFVKHQDNAYVQAPSDAFVSAWTALCDVDEENGCLLFYPDSHRQGLLPTRFLDHVAVLGQNPGAEAVECVLHREIEPIPMRLKRGSTVFFHGDLVHGSLPNTSTDRFRYSFLATYIRSGSPFRPGRLQQRTEVDLHPAT